MVGRYIGHHEPHFIIDPVLSAAAHPRPTPPTPPVLNGQPPPFPPQDTKQPTTRSLQSHRITSSITRCSVQATTKCNGMVCYYILRPSIILCFKK